MRNLPVSSRPRKSATLGSTSRSAAIEEPRDPRLLALQSRFMGSYGRSVAIRMGPLEPLRSGRFYPFGYPLSRASRCRPAVAGGPIDRSRPFRRNVEAGVLLSAAPTRPVSQYRSNAAIGPSSASSSCRSRTMRMSADCSLASSIALSTMSPHGCRAAPSSGQLD